MEHIPQFYKNVDKNLIQNSKLQILLVTTLLLLLSSQKINGQLPSLQLESKLSHLTNIIQDRDYQSMYDVSLPKNKFKGKAYPPSAKLIEGLTPLHYSLFIRPILEDTGVPGEKFTAPGIVKISFTCTQPTDNVLVHAVEMEIVHEFVEIRHGQRLDLNFKIKSRHLVANESVYKIQLEEPLEKDQEYQLTIAFTSIVSRERLNGLYLSNYTDPVTKEVRYMATTQFESVHARKAFPCFDEPHLKATFDVSIGRQLAYNTISNMNLISTEPIVGLKDWVWDHYNTTMKMSTYLLAFIVSDFISETADLTFFNGKPVRIWAPKHSIDAKHGAYAAQVAAKVLNFYENYFQMPYPLPKMDSIVVHFFSSGAMENWGANTYRENLLLHRGNQTTESERFDITSVVSHELAHQNFGNMVTCARWNHLWLNEGFATYVSFLGVNEVAPEFKPFDLFYTKETQIALKYDSSRATHPVVNTTTDTSSTGDFDKITYQKGASLIRMMEGFLGKSTLQTGLRKYLKRFAYSNALTDNLLEELNAQAHLDGKLEPSTMTVKKIMDTYILKSGYPLIKIERTTNQVIQNGRSSSGQFIQNLTISQMPFKSHDESTSQVEQPEPAPAAHSQKKDLWWVPLSIKSSFNPNFNNTQPDLWLPKDVAKTEWTLVGQSDSDTNVSMPTTTTTTTLLEPHWILVNPLAGGYYRVIYDSHLTSLLQKKLVENPQIFPPTGRAQLIDDYFTAAHSHYVPIESALGFTDYLHKETELIVWTTTFLNIKRIYNMLRTGRSFEGFNTFFQTRVASALNKIGGLELSRDGSHKQNKKLEGSEIVLQSHLLDWACNLEYVGCTALAKKLLRQWMTSDPTTTTTTYNPIPVDIRPVMYCTAVASSSKNESTKNDDAIWNFFWKKYQEADNSLEKFKLISALCCSKDPKMINFLLDETLNSTGLSKISKTDASITLQRLAASTVGSQLVFDKIRQNLNQIIKRFGSTDPIAYAISSLSIYWNQQSQLEDLQKFLKDNANCFEAGVDKLIKNSVKIVQDNVKWMTKFDHRVSQWFAQRVVEERRKNFV